MARYERDYYRILGVHLEATEDEIRRAYRRLALQWHPDRNPGSSDAEERFKEISEAYGVLMDRRKRGDYDRVRRGTGPGDFRVNRDDVFRDLFTDPRASAIFEELAREFQRLGLRMERRDFQATLFGGRTVMSGHVVIVSPWTPLVAFARLVGAALRGGRAGAPAPSLPETPPQRITRRLGRVARWFFGLPTPAAETALAVEDVVVPLRVTTDEARRGARKQVALPDGGQVVVQIPAGVRSGTRLRLRGKGRRRDDGSRGDAYLTVEVR